jgi:hypothetical protein
MRPRRDPELPSLARQLPPSPRRESVTNWSLEGRAALPSDQPFEEWPPFELDLTFRWDKVGGCSVDSRAL